MPYTTLVSGTTITASWANSSVRDQVVTPFATTAARDSAITVPVNGMVAAITSNDSNEGLVVRNSANQWRQPWNISWGCLAYVTVTANQTGITTQVDLTGLTTTLTTIANRRLWISAQVEYQSTVADDECLLAVMKDGTQITRGIIGVRVVNNDYTCKCDVADTPTAASHTYKLQGVRVVGTGTVRMSAGALVPAWIKVEDQGPNGAPA